jgi:hypothetical protein
MASKLHATVKLHKQNILYQEAHSKWKNSPAHNTAKLITQMVKETINLMYTYNIKNIINSMNNL